MLITVTLKKDEQGRWTATGVADPTLLVGKPAQLKVAFDNGAVLFEGTIRDGLGKLQPWLAVLTAL